MDMQSKLETTDPQKLEEVRWETLDSFEKQIVFDQIFELSQKYNYPGNVWWHSKDSAWEAIQNGEYNPGDYFTIYFSYESYEYIVKLG